MADMVRKSSMLADFSAEATTKAVRRAARSNPMTTYPVVGGLLGGMVMLLFGASTVPLVGTIACGLVGCGSYFYRRFIMWEKYLADHLAKVREQTKDAQLHVLEIVNSEQLRMYADEVWEGQSLARDTLSQLGEATRKRDTLLQAVTDTFQKGSLYERHLQAAEEMYLALLHTIRAIRQNLMNVKSISLVYIEELLARDDLDPERRRALEGQKTIHDDHMQTIKKLLVQNENVLYEVDRLTQVVIETAADDVITLNRICTEISQLAERVRLYSESGLT